MLYNHNTVWANLQIWLYGEMLWTLSKTVTIVRLELTGYILISTIASMKATHDCCCIARLLMKIVASLFWKHCSSSNYYKLGTLSNKGCRHHGMMPGLCKHHFRQRLIYVRHILKLSDRLLEEQGLSFVSVMFLLVSLGFSFVSPRYNHKTGGLGCVYMQCGSVYTQAVCGANDLFPGKSVLVSCLCLYSVWSLPSATVLHFHAKSTSPKRSTLQPWDIPLAETLL